MRSAYISRRQAEGAFDGSEYEYEDVLAVQAPVDVPGWEDAEQAVELELTAAEHAAAAAFLVSEGNQRQAARAVRRTARTVLGRNFRTAVFAALGESEAA